MIQSKTTIHRRSLLKMLGAGGLLAGLDLPGIAFANAPTDNRLVVVILRGALDGLAAVVPYGDAHYAERRKTLAMPMPGEADGVLPLDATFALNPALGALQPLWAKEELAIVPASAGGYQTRSHFDAQDMMEAGTIARAGSGGGWLNRALADLQPAGGTRRLGLAVGDAVPLTLRGRVPVAEWAPPDQKPAEAGFLASLEDLYAKDKVLGPALAEAVKARDMDAAVLGMQGPEAAAKQPNVFATLAQAAGGLLAAETGPRIAVLEMGGWDTHVGQGTVKGRLAPNLRQLADGLEALRTSLGPSWSRTAIVVMTEFGRTVAPNGTGGTDHGTASVALLLGGAVRGGRVVGDWPGLETLVEDRDLRMGTELRAVLKGLLRDHLGIGRAHLDTVVFPDSAGVSAMTGLLKV